MTLADLVFIDSTGYHYADYPTILEWLKQEFRDIYGADVYLEADSQDGQWVAIQAKAYFDMAAFGAAVYNSYSPVSAQGIGLSRNVKINGLERQSPTFSTVDVVIIGTVGTVLNGAVAIDQLDQKWSIPDGTTIPISGTITVTATSLVIGDIEAAANSVNRIFTPTLGWQSVNNPAIATAGAPVETDAELRQRQAISTANPSLTVLEGQLGAVANLPGVTKVKSYENDTDTTDANSVPPHCVALMVIGGDTDEIAQTIQRHKTPGTATSGTTSRTVYDSRGMPLLISFTRPTKLVITVKITLSARTGWTTDYEALISAAVADMINQFGIGDSVLLTKLFAPAYLIGTIAGGTYDIVTIELAKNGGSFAAANVAVAFNEYADCDVETAFTYVVT